jgi:hypothetical protein
MYVIPLDGVDRQLDTNGTIEGSAASFQGWLKAQTGGRGLRIDTSGGSMDISFHRLSRTNAEIASHGAFVRDEIEDELNAAGFSAPQKVYAVYYDGSSTHSCGGGAWPPTLPGNVAAMYLLGTPPGSAPCSSNSFRSGSQAPGYFEVGMLHEVLHTLGFVATCSPNHTMSGHVSDAPRDLMWAGSAPWDIPNMTLDVGRDDYYDHFLPGCRDLADSAYLDSAPGASPSPTPSSTPTPTPTATPTSTPDPSEGGSPAPKSVTLTASRHRAQVGQRVRLSATVMPCGGHEGDTIEFYKGTTLISENVSSRACTSSIRVRMRKTTTFRAVSPQQDTDHLGSESKPLRVRVIPRQKRL